MRKSSQKGPKGGFREILYLFSFLTEKDEMREMPDRKSRDTKVLQGMRGKVNAALPAVWFSK